MFKQVYNQKFKLFETAGMKKLKNFLTDYRSTPLLLLIVTVLSYGILAPFIGLYMDDWYILWFKHVFGILEYPRYFALDRPLMGYFYVAASYLLGGSESPLVWQIFTIFLRWLTTYALWGMANTLWPDAKRQNTWVALLAAVFPGFTQQWFAIIYSFFFACLAGFFFSITLMVRALQNRKKFWLYYLFSLLLMAYCVLASEFYFGLELVRGVVIWLVLSRSQGGFWPKVWRTLKYWAAYLVIFIAFSVWRAFFFVSVNHSVSILTQFLAHPKLFFLSSLRKVYQSGIDSLLNTWVNPFNINNYPSQGIMGMVILALSLVFFVGLFLWLRRQNKDSLATIVAATNWHKEAFWIGLISILVALLPFWAADLEISYRYPFDRFMLAYLMGSCLLVVAFLEFISDHPRKTFLIVAVLVTAGAAYQMATANVYKNLWTQQKAFYWQLNWRIPALQPDTALLSWDMPNGEYYSGYALSAQLNWTYADTIVDRQTPYEFILLSSGQSKEIRSLSPDSEIKSSFRTYTFSGNTSDTVYIYYDGENCLRVLDDSLTPALTVLPDYTSATLEAANRSNPARILASGTNHPPLQILGAEPAHNWCYYFEKADLARQFKQYAQTLSLLQEAEAKGYQPKVLSEWYPFIDAALHTGDLEQAQEFSQNALVDQAKIYESGVCYLWSNYQKEVTDPTMRSQIDSTLTGYHCQ